VIYRAYGLVLDSALPLPELDATRASPDVAIRLSRDRFDRDATRPCRRMPDGWLLSRPPAGDFYVRGGREILIAPDGGRAPDFLREILLGPAMAMLLHERGRFILHASAVELDGAAVAFLGDSGDGKSTLALALRDRGCRILTDDVLAIDLQGSRAVAIPAYPQIRLVEKGTSGKRAVPVPRDFVDEPRPLACAYVLAPGRRGTAIEQLEPQASFLELVRHSYCAPLVEQTGAPLHFAQCGTLLTAMPVFRLAFERDLTALPLLADAIRAHVKDVASVRPRTAPVRPSPASAGAPGRSRPPRP
jgi:hypothetical protein